MHRILQESREYSDAYIDNVFINSETWEEHLEHLTNILERIRKAETREMLVCEESMHLSQAHC